jgi:hypothetical protein
MAVSTKVKWRILLRVLPLTTLFCIAKVGMHYLGFEPWAFDSLTASLFGAATFVIALILSGTLSDYGACAKMPMQISNSIASIQDSSELLAASHPEFDTQPIQKSLDQIISAILGWLKDDKVYDEIETTISQLTPLLVPMLAIENGVAFTSRIQGEQAMLRSLTQQMKGSRDTDFLEPAYVLLWIFLSGSIVALLLIGAERFSENLTVSAFLFTSFFYLLFLIRDLDNPFEYHGKSSVDVDLSVLEAMGDRLSKQNNAPISATH